MKARDEFPLHERREASAAAGERLFGLPEFRSARAVLFFASFRSEVGTEPLVRRALAEGKRVILPRVVGRELELIEVRDYDADIEPGAWGIPEPKNGPPVPLTDIDLIVVPGAAFDARGNRIGYGAGFYDKLLPVFSGPTVALAFDLQVLPEVPADPHDVPVQIIVTEKRVIRVRR